MLLDAVSGEDADGVCISGNVVIGEFDAVCEEFEIRLEGINDDDESQEIVVDGA
jgi:hypothetical protein